MMTLTTAVTAQLVAAQKTYFYFPARFNLCRGIRIRQIQNKRKQSVAQSNFPGAVITLPGAQYVLRLFSL